MQDSKTKAAAETPAGLEFDPSKPLGLARARHFMNRFGFGAQLDDLERLGACSPQQLIRVLGAHSKVPKLDGPLRLVRWDEYGFDKFGNQTDAPEIMKLPRAERFARMRALRREDKDQFQTYTRQWFDQMIEGRDPLRDRMTLFWHGFFPTSVQATRRRYELIQQHRMLRRHALGNFGDLLRGMITDAAMLAFFDNENNVAEQPNENFARELLELYSLGEGNYSETDIREAARALTGYKGDSGTFVFDRSDHDGGEKTILGHTGPFHGVELADVILAQPACARYVARRLLEWFEGLEPSAARIEEYATLLRQEEYDVLPLLEQLAIDPAFYAEPVVGTRVLAPIELLIGACRRVKCHPDTVFIYFAAAYLGQQFYSPPSVKGWNEGEAWITAESLTRRSNCFGLLLGALEPTDEDEAVLGELVTVTHAFRMEGIRLAELMRLALGPLATDEELVNHTSLAWLARSADGALVRELHLLLRAARERHGAQQGPLLAQPQAEQVLRDFGHRLLATPLAQLG